MSKWKIGTAQADYGTGFYEFNSQTGKYEAPTPAVDVARDPYRDPPPNAPAYDLDYVPPVSTGVATGSPPTDDLPIPYKYNEPALIEEVRQYIANTYSGHYVGEDNIQSLDLIIATGHATGFNIGNVLKYGSRYGKKKGYNRDDLLKVIHYAIFELFNHSNEHSGK